MSSHRRVGRARGVVALTCAASLLMPLSPSAGHTAPGTMAQHTPLSRGLPAATLAERRGGWTPYTRVVANDPNGGTRQQYAIVREMLRNIARSPRGSVITIVAYSYALGRVTDALADARRRGVVVRAVLNQHSRRWTPARRLARILNTRLGDSSFLRWSQGSTRMLGGNMHQKSWTFSRVGRARAVTMVGSTNLTRNCAERQFADMLVLANRPAVYRTFQRVFAYQSRMRNLRQPYYRRTFRGGDVYFLPMRHWTAREDPVVRRVVNIPARGASIHISAYSWWNRRGAAIARALAAKSRAGARVEAIIGPSTSLQVRRILRSGRVRMRWGVFPNGTHVHSKLMIATYRRPAGRIWKVWTGSDNWANESIGHDEVALGYRSRRLFREYAAVLRRIPQRRLGASRIYF